MSGRSLGRRPRAHPFVSLLATAAVVLAGCLAPPEAEPPTELDVEKLIGEPLAFDHDHTDPALHNQSYGVHSIGQTFGYEGETMPPLVEFGELAWNKGWVYMCRMPGNTTAGERSPDGGFVIIDARNPANPTPVGAMNGLGCFDVKTDKTGDLVFWAQQRHKILETPMLLEGTDYLPRGVGIVDVSEREAPRTVGWFPSPPNGVHTLRYYCMEEADADPDAPCAGREIVFLQTYDLTSRPLGWAELATVGGQINEHATDVTVTQRITITEVVRDGDEVRLEPIGLVQERIPPRKDKGYRPHDSWPERHLLTGDHLLYVSYWDHGVLTYDINDPANPRLLSRYDDFTPSNYGKIHFATTSPTLIDGKVILVAEPELQVAPETGQFTIIDMSDPTAPEKLGWWTLPGGLIIEQDYRYSPHNFNIANERIYSAHNHGGVWVVDISDPANPTSAGYYLPSVSAETYKGVAPVVWSAFYHDGLIYASTHGSGLHVLHFESDPWPTGDYLAAAWSPP